MTELNTAFDNAAPAEATTAAAPVVVAAPTKEEKIAAVKAQIKRLEEKLYNIENDIVVVKASKVVALPNVGDAVLFSYGRKTATTNPVLKDGTVVAIKAAGKADNGKTLPAQIKVQTGEGFDIEFVTIYPAQIVTKNEDGTQSAPADEADADDAS